MKHTEIEDIVASLAWNGSYEDAGQKVISELETERATRLIKALINSQLRATLERLKDKSKSYTVDVLRSDDYEVKEWAIPLSAIDEELSKLEEK